MQPNDIQSLYRDELPKRCMGAWKPWRSRYLAFAERVRGTKRAEWMTAKFQEYLWESDEISGVGMGTSVVLTTVYADTEVAELLWQAREKSLPPESAGRGDAISGVFEATMNLVTPKHNKRRPSAKLVRVLAGLFPHDVLCLLDDYKTLQVRRLLGLKRHAEHLLRQHLRIRDELARVIGPAPATLEGAVERGMFAWLLYEQAMGHEEQTDAGAVAPPATPQVSESQPTAPPLALLPRDKQYLGLNHVQDALRLVNTMVRDAEHGITRKDLVANIQLEVPTLSAKSAAMQIGMVHQRLGLLELVDGEAYRPTPLGRELLEGERASDILAPVLLRRIWGFAQLLDLLRRTPEGARRTELGAELKAQHGSWRTSMMTSQILEWCRELELVEDEPHAGGYATFSLSEAGAQWASRLPDLSAWDARNGSAPLAASQDEEASADPSDAPPVAFAPASFDAIARRFEVDPALARLVLPKDLLALLHAALHASAHKRFALLAGLSGTGKTSIAEAYARAYCAASAVPPSDHMLRVPVSPDWADPSGLLGYVNPLGGEESFRGTLTLELLLRASNNPDKPYFLTLDEMNLARVEHYFAPFLSAMEGDRSSLVLHTAREAVDNVPNQIEWPRNLFIIGTVNMDETTHAFSDKVLDRAFSFELWDVDLPTWRAKAKDGGAAEETLAAIYQPLVDLHAALRPARRHFGYRTCNEILGFCSAVPTSARAGALDASVLAKILPKIRGDDSGPLPHALDAVGAVCKTHGLAGSAEKVAAMRASLQSVGVVRFSS